jgi:hypothetical protein
VIASPPPRPRGALLGGRARVRPWVRSRCCSLSTLSPRRPRGAGPAESGPMPAGGWDRLRLAASPKVPRFARFRSGGGYKPTAAPFQGRQCHLGWTARFRAWGPRWKVQSDPAPRPLSGAARWVCLLPTLWLSRVGSAHAVTGPLLSAT